MARLRHNARRLKDRALNSLSLSIELFNRPYDSGRTEAVLVLLQHAFEMLIKAKIWQERGTIWEGRSRISHRFDKCLRIARDDLCVLDADGFTSLSMLSELRDCAAHNILELSEDGLYLHVQAGVSLFAQVLTDAFGEALSDYLPNRVLPISTTPPKDIEMFMDHEFDEVRTLLAPRRRQQAEAHARLRPILIMESALQDSAQQPTTGEVSRAAYRLKQGEDWRTIFPGIATLKLDSSGGGLTYTVKLTRDQGAAPVRLLRPGEEADDATLIREVNLLDRYSLGLKQIAVGVGITEPKALAVIRFLHLQEDVDCFKEFNVGKTAFRRYSPKALEAIRAALPGLDMDEIWRLHRPRRAVPEAGLEAAIV